MWVKVLLSALVCLKLLRDKRVYVEIVKIFLGQVLFLSADLADIGQKIALTLQNRRFILIATV